MSKNIKPEDLLIEILEEFGCPVIRQGSMDPEEEYPEHFFTFWNNESTDRSHYDNQCISKVYDFDVNVYSVDPEKTYTMLQDAIDHLKEHGFIISGDGYDVASDEKTHTGRGVNALFMKY
jgi:hypothetical protein|nr:MAG TPA: hypothetical protein [Caudoviricetes sp.]